MFEQSGVFKNEFKKLGYEAFDYDIQNNFGETDYQIDLFAEIEKGYDNQPSIFDKIGVGRRLAFRTIYNHFIDTLLCQVFLFIDILSTYCNN